MPSQHIAHYYYFRSLWPRSVPIGWAGASDNQWKACNGQQGDSEFRGNSLCWVLRRAAEFVLPVSTTLSSIHFTRELVALLTFPTSSTLLSTDSITQLLCKCSSLVRMDANAHLTSFPSCPEDPPLPHLPAPTLSLTALFVSQIMVLYFSLLLLCTHA